MEKEYVVITEIYFKHEKISRKRKEKTELSKQERNQLIGTIFYSNYKRMNNMDLYSFICMTLREKYNIRICERTVMRVVKRQ
jgi:hypothetical protein